MTEFSSSHEGNSPDAAFEAIIGANPGLERLSVPTPPWIQAASLLDDDAFTAEGADRAYEDAATSIDEAYAVDPMFEGLLYQLIEDAQGSSESLDSLFSETATQSGIKEAAWLVEAVPDPADAEAIFERYESRRVSGEDAEAAAWEAQAQSAQLDTGAPSHELDELVMHNRSFMDPRKRALTYQHVLQVVYGDRYQAYVAQTGHAS